MSGDRIVQASWLGTAAFTVAATAATVAPDALAVPVAVFDVFLFVVGTVAFLAAFGRAVGRSRHEVLSVAGIFLLAGSAPRPMQWRLLGALGVQVVVAVVTASIRLYTSLAFGMLVPMYGLGLAGLWAARHGSFPPRPQPPERPARRVPERRPGGGER